jgi:hypothetical protein
MPGNEPRTIVIRTLGDLGPNERLWASCERCGHSLKLDLEDLRTKYGTRMPIRRIAGMLRCGRCRNRDARLMLTYSNSG